MTSHFAWVSVRRLLNSTSVLWRLPFSDRRCAPLLTARTRSSYPARAAPQRPSRSQLASPDEVPAHIAIVDGAATLEREGRIESTIENVALVAGDRLQTEQGRVECFSPTAAHSMSMSTRRSISSLTPWYGCSPARPSVDRAARRALAARIDVAGVRRDSHTGRLSSRVV
jgi:hypothetical protein